MTFLISLLIFTGCIWALLVRSKLREDHWDKTHAHRAGQSLIQSNTSEAGHSHSYYVTQDPEEYAKIFVPKS